MRPNAHAAPYMYIQTYNVGVTSESRVKCPRLHSTVGPYNMIYFTFIIPHVNFPCKTSIDERLIFYNITRCYSDGEYCHSFAIAAGDIIKYQSFVWCATAMRVRFVHVRIRFTAMADIGHEFGHFQLPITSLFLVRKIKCGYSFS